MGLATIISHVGEGLYRVRPEYDWSKLEAELAKLDREDEDNEKLRQQLLLDIADQIVVVAQKEGALNEAIQIDKVQPSGETEPGRMVGGITSEDGTVLVDSVKIPDLPTVSSAVMDATVALAIERKILEALKLRRSEVEAGYITRQKRRNTLNSARDKINYSEIQAWCVDYSTEIAPDTKVRTIEVPGYRLKGEPSMVIAPGGSGTSGVKYGQLRSALTMTPETVFLNAALEPGHLKWRPRWRYGQITWISESEDKCHVALEQEWGRRVDVAPKMPLNDKANLENVPIRYMGCNRQAFEVEDWVVVEWKENEPAVIGFRSEPKPCKWPARICFRNNGYVFSTDDAALFASIFRDDAIVEWRTDSGAAWQRLYFHGSGGSGRWRMWDADATEWQADPFIFIERDFSIRDYSGVIAEPDLLPYAVFVQPKGVDSNDPSGITEYRILNPETNAEVFKAAVSYDADMIGGYVGRVAAPIKAVTVTVNPFNRAIPLERIER